MIHIGSPCGYMQKLAKKKNLKQIASKCGKEHMPNNRKYGHMHQNK
jgi:hypothetical protein